MKCEYKGTHLTIYLMTFRGSRKIASDRYAHTVHMKCTKLVIGTCSMAIRFNTALHITYLSSKQQFDTTVSLQFVKKA